MDNLKAGAKVALGLFIVLLSGSIYFYKERMLFADDSFYAFNIINSGSFLVSNRYASFITQVFPLVASKLKLQTSTVLLIYSLSFNLFYLFVAWFLYKSKQYALVIIMAFYFSLYVSDSYYWTNNEIHQGIAWMFLNFGVLHYLLERYALNTQRGLLISLPVFTLLSFPMVYSHALVIMPFFFLWMLFLLMKRPFYYSRQSIWYLAIVILICLVKLLNSGRYDEEKMQNITHMTLQSVLNTFVSRNADVFWREGLTNYWILWVIFIIGCAAILRARKYTILALTVLSSVAYFVLVCLTYTHETPRFYIECEWMSITILGSAGFVYYILPRLQSNKAAMLLVVIFFIRILYILHSSTAFIERLDWLNQMVAMMDRKGINKMVIAKTDDRLEKKLLVTWALPYEMMLLTSIQKEKTTKVLSHFDEPLIEQTGVRTETRCIAGPWNHHCPENLNRFYFNPDSTSNYLIVSLDQLEKL